MTERQKDSPAPGGLAAERLREIREQHKRDLWAGGCEPERVDTVGELLVERDRLTAALDAATAALASAEKRTASDKRLAVAVGAFLAAYDDEAGSTWGDVERFVPAMRSAFAALAPATPDAEARHAAD